MDKFELIIQINLLGTFRCIALSTAGMMTLDPVDEYGERGAVINTASVAAEDGQMVVALVRGDSATVKKLYREPGNRIRLQPANPTMSAMGEVKIGLSQMASAPSSATCGRRRMIPFRSPTPSPESS